MFTDSRESAVLEEAFAEYRKYTCIQWVPNPRGGQRFVDIIKDNGCYSYVGFTFDKSGGQPLSLGNGCLRVSILSNNYMHNTIL